MLLKKPKKKKSPTFCIICKKHFLDKQSSLPVYLGLGERDTYTPACVWKPDVYQSFILSFILLRQVFSLDLELDWWPANPGGPLFSALIHVCIIRRAQKPVFELLHEKIFLLTVKVVPILRSFCRFLEVRILHFTF